MVRNHHRYPPDHLLRGVRPPSILLRLAPTSHRQVRIRLLLADACTRCRSRRCGRPASPSVGQGESAMLIRPFVPRLSYHRRQRPGRLHLASCIFHRPGDRPPPTALISSCVMGHSSFPHYLLVAISGSWGSRHSRKRREAAEIP